MTPEIITELQTLAQIAVAIVLGGAVGWERETAGKWAGLRTHSLVAAAAVLFVQVGSILATSTAIAGEHLRADPIRILEALVTGIAFLGAGTIFRDTEDKMRGLTTAASLLATGAIGTAVAVDRYVIAVGSTILALFVLRALKHLEIRD